MVHFFVRDGIHSDADYNSTRVGVLDLDLDLDRLFAPVRDLSLYPDKLLFGV